jgi:hypothetical protein
MENAIVKNRIDRGAKGRAFQTAGMLRMLLAVLAVFVHALALSDGSRTAAQQRAAPSATRF